MRNGEIFITSMYSYSGSGWRGRCYKWMTHYGNDATCFLRIIIVISIRCITRNIINVIAITDIN